MSVTATAAATALDVGERSRGRFGIGCEIGDDDSSCCFESPFRGERGTRCAAGELGSGVSVAGARSTEEAAGIAKAEEVAVPAVFMPRAMHGTTICTTGLKTVV